MRVFGRSIAILLALAAFLWGAPTRIVSLSPNTTEILYGVGAFAHVVGVSQFCSYPPEVSKLPRVGGWQTSDVEKILSLHPDLVVLTEAQEQFIAERLRAFHLRYVAVRSDSLVDIFSAIQIIGSATGNEKRAADLASSIHKSLDAIRSATKSLPKKSVLLAVSRTPGTLSDLYVATTGSFLVDLLDIAGGRSVAAPDRSGYGKLSTEALLNLNPEVIIDLMRMRESRFGENSAAVWNDLPELRAVRNKQVIAVNDESVVHPSQFVVQTAELFLRILHPELGRSAPAH